MSAESMQVITYLLQACQQKDQQIQQLQQRIQELTSGGTKVPAPIPAVPPPPPSEAQKALK